jgi:hypothetical protein
VGEALIGVKTPGPFALGPPERSRRCPSHARSKRPAPPAGFAERPKTGPLTGPDTKRCAGAPRRASAPRSPHFTLPDST